MWNGNGGSTWSMTEEEQLAWAAKESFFAEEERRKRKKQEEADLALALELSKREESSKI